MADSASLSAIARSLKGIEVELRRKNRVLETLNDNLVLFGRRLAAEDDSVQETE